jgi:uncharacterized protein YeaO (DUF488 family)
MIHIKRAYELPRQNDGARFLIDRLWPRGVSKEQAHLDEWYKDVAPSTELREWFGHDPNRWEEFKNSYTAELEKHQETWKGLLKAAEMGDITLVYSARDQSHNNAVVVKDYLEKKMNHTTTISKLENK